MVNVYANKSMFGKRTGKHTAELGEFNAEGTTATEAKTALLATIAGYRPTKYAIGTGSGDVFIVMRALTGQMEYTICGAGRTYGSSCLMATHDAKAAIEAAREHARQSFGGIVWEHTL